MEEMQAFEENNFKYIMDCSCESNLKEKDKLLNAIFQVANVGICITDEEGLFTMVNDEYCRIYGYTEDELIGKPYTIVIPPENKAMSIKNYRYSMKNNTQVINESKVVNKDGKLLDVYITSVGLIKEDGEKLRVTTVTDITGLKETYNKLNLITQALSNAREGVIFTTSDPTKIAYVNEAFFQITGFDKLDLIRFQNNLLEVGIGNIEFYNYILNKIDSNGFWEGEVTGVKKNKEKYFAELTIRTIKDSSGTITNYLGIINEVTFQKNVEKKIQYLTNYSSITDLPNRQVFEGRVNKVIEESKSSEKVALIMIDLNRFRNINETYGFGIGDKLLKAVGYRIKYRIKNEDLLAYLGEDQFGILIKGINKQKDVLNLAEEIYKSISTKFILEGNEINITCSIGICIYPDEGNNSDDLINRAEEAIKEAKKHGVNSIQLYTSEMNKRLSRRHQIENDLKSCIENKEVFLVYQPQVELKWEKVVGVEALIRWNHPLYGFIPPDEFISIAEEIGMINEIGNWVFKTAFTQGSKWQSMGLPDFKISVNLSPIQLMQNNFFEMFMKNIKESGVNSELVELEITEGTMMQNVERAIKIFNELKEKGIKTAIDDFGTGYSSLSYLRKIPINKLKIDRSFITDFKNDFEGSIITKTIIDMAKNLGFKVIAEGAETEDQIQYLKNNGCDEVQGYYYSKPLSPEELEAFIRKTNKKQQ